MQEPTESEQLSSKAGQLILEQLPERIRKAMIARAAEIDCPVETLIEVAIAGYLDPHAIGFVDCDPDRKA